MNKLILTIALVFITTCANCQSLDQDRAAIKAVMAAQQTAWSSGDLEEFMAGYVKSDSLKFFGARGLTLGWQQTLDNYKKSYPTLADRGTLTFTLEDISPIEKNSYWVMGRYHLARTVGDAEGVFIIIFKKINGQWKIVADMSC